MTAGLTFSGLATGLDTARIVEELVKAERRPIQRLEGQKSVLGFKSDLLRDVRDLLTTLQESARALDSRPETLLSRATSSQEGAVRASAEGDASLGSFDVSVTSLAQAERTYSNAFSDKDVAGLFGSGTLTIQVGAEAAVNIDVTGTDTLETVVSKINASGANVTAGLFFDGTNHRLQVSGNETGAANAISFSESGTSLGLIDPVNEIKSAADAVFQVDGFAMTSSTNTVSDAIPGVRLELLAPTAGNATVSIERDPEAIEEKVQAFVDAYNGVMTKLNEQFAFNGEGKVGNTFSGDATLRGLQTSLRREVGRVVAGLAEPHNALYSIGIGSKIDGTLELDGDKLAAALAEDSGAVASLLIDDPAAGITGVLASLDTMIDGYVDSSSGLLSEKIEGFDTRSRRIDDQIDQMELRVDKYEMSLRAQFASLETLVSQLQGQNNQMVALLGQLQQ
ncbi:MAG: flagellar filament capping protein FliD [Myxococcales bacterium]|nr:flagellar filament capping protein FliD [Myxococcales bacterium]